MASGDDIRRTVEGINEAWVNGRPDELARFFAPDVVFALPDFSGRLVGRDACVQTFRDFLNQAVVHSFSAAPPQVDIVGATAIATLTYEIEYELTGKRWRGTGRDLLVLAQRDGTWRVVWRCLFPGEEEEAGDPSGGG